MQRTTGRKLLDPEGILRQAHLSAGMTYADFGAGALGHFVLPAARLVGPGTPVYAVDILKSVLEAVQSRAALEHVQNIKPIWGDIEKIHGVNLPDGSLDVLSIVNLAGLVKKSPNVLEEAKRLLKEDGKLLLVGWKETSPSPIAPPKDQRVSIEEMKECVSRAGLVLMKTFEASTDHWGLLVRRKPFQDYPIKIIG